MNLNHKHVIKILSAGRSHLIVNDVNLGERNYIVSELCEKGDLFEYVQETDNGLTEKVARSLFAQLISAIDYIH